MGLALCNNGPREHAARRALLEAHRPGKRRAQGPALLGTLSRCQESAGFPLAGNP